MRSSVFVSAGIISVFLISCLNFKNEEPESINRQDFKPVKISNEFILSVPKYMKEAKNLNEAASLQYQNIYKEVYVIVIDEDKQTFIDTFTDLEEYDSTKTPVENYRVVQMKSLVENVNVSQQTKPVALKINTLDAQQVQFDGNVEDLNNEISYFLTFLEGKDKMYMIMAWTLKDRKEKYSKMFETVAGTFKQL
jgi:hypothetical protein